MKQLIPSLREKKRYMAFEIISEGRLSKMLVNDAINESALKFLGGLNYGKAGVKIINNDGRYGVVRVNNKFLDNVRVGMMMIKNIEDKRVIFKINKVSGVLNKLRLNKKLKLNKIKEAM